MDQPEIKSHPLGKLCKTWLEKVRLAKEDKRKKFSADAEEAMKFFDNTGDWLDLNAKRAAIRSDSAGTEKLEAPMFEMRVNKVAEMRDLFGPAIYHTNPVVSIEPHDLTIVPPEALGIDTNALQQIQEQIQQMQMQLQQNPVLQQNPQLMQQAMLQQNPQMMQQFQMLQQQMAQYQQMQQQEQMDDTASRTACELIKQTLNYMQRETDKKTESRKALDEALIMGMGVLWTEVVSSEEGTKLVGSYYDSVKRVGWDPDAKVYSDLKWVYRECIHAYWEVEDQYQLPRGTLKGKGIDESYEQESELNGDPDAMAKKAKGKTNDLVRYYKIYSRMGMGERLKNMKDDSGQMPDALAEELEQFGENCFLVVMDGIPYPLNLPWDVVTHPMVEDGNGNDQFQFPQQVVTQQQPDPTNPMVPPVDAPVMGPDGQPQTELRSDVFLAFQWPIPFWAADCWPFEPVYFRWKPDELWPMPIVKSGIGELRLINWIYSFLAVKVRRCCQTTVGLVKSAGEDIKRQLLSGNDFNIVEIEQALGTSIDQIVSFLQAPQWHPDILMFVDRLFELFDKRVGLTELIYGMTSNQLRTAEEANVKQQNMSIRPDDMANLAEDWMSKVARKEGMVLRWLVQGKDVQPYLGQLGAMAWDKLVASQDLDVVTKEFRYRIEAGSMRKPNRQREISDANSALQSFGQIAWQYATQTGNTSIMNVLMQKWAKANDVELPPIPPIQMAPPPGQQPPQQNKQQPNQHPQQPQHQAA